MELTKKDTKMMQGLSVLAMLCLHLFNRDYVGLFQPTFFLFGIPLSFYFSQLSDFCVMGFAFCSGYAHMKLYDEPDYYKRRVKSLRSLLCNYYIILIVFSIISVMVGNGAQMPGNVRTFILNALMLENSYNGAWWYMFIYVILVLLSPIVLKSVKRIHPVIILGFGFVIYCCAYYTRFYITTDNWILLKFGPFGMTLFEYLIGAVCFKTGIFSWLYKYWKKMKGIVQSICGITILVGMLIIRTLLIPSLFVAPLTGLILLVLFHFWKKPKCVEKFFELIGKHSTNIWLTHMFFYLCLFKNFVYVVKFPILIYMLMLGITLLISCGLQKIEKSLVRRIT